MTDFAQNQPTLQQIPVVIQYQDVGAPPPTTQAVAPTFFATYAPAYFPPRYPEHPQPFMPPLFETIPAPALAARAHYPDRLERAQALTVYPQPVMNIDPIAPPVPELSWQPISPDRLERLRGLWPMPYKSEQNINPIADVTVPFGRLGFYPDRLERARALVEYPQPVMNLEPIPGATAPTFFEANMPARLNRFPPPVHRPFFYTPTPNTFLVLEDYSRGLHVGDIRGFYHTPGIATSEPYCIALFGTSQVFPTGGSGTFVELGAASFSAITASASDLGSDPWSMLDTINNRIIIKHPGYYQVSATLGLTMAGSDIPAEIQLLHYGNTGDPTSIIGSQPQLARDRRIATNHRITITAPLRPMVQGNWIKATLFHAAGIDLTAGTQGLISVIRLAGPGTRRKLPIPS